jgi:hypothetical protein
MLEGGDLNLLVQGGQVYRAHPFSKTSLATFSTLSLILFQSLQSVWPDYWKKCPIFVQSFKHSCWSKKMPKYLHHRSVWKPETVSSKHSWNTQISTTNNVLKLINRVKMQKIVFVKSNLKCGQVFLYFIFLKILMSFHK